MKTIGGDLWRTSTKHQSLRIKACLLLIFIFVILQLPAQDQNPDQLKQQMLSNNDSLRFCALTELGYFFAKNDPDSSRFYLEKAREMMQEDDNIASLLQVRFYNSFGVFFADQEVMDSATWYYQKALLISEENKHEAFAGKIHYNLGLISTPTSYDKALHHYETALDYFTRLEDTVALANSLTAIGSLISNFNTDKSLALPYYDQALALYKSAEDKNGQVVLLFNIGVNLYNIDELDQALVRAEEGIKIAKTLEVYSLIYLHFGYQLLGNIHFKLQNSEESIDVFRLALDCAAKLNRPSSIMESTLSLSKVYVESGEEQEVVSILNTGLQYVSKPDEQLSSTNLHFKYRFKTSLAHVFAKMGNKAKAIALISSIDESLLSALSNPQRKNILNRLYTANESIGDFESALGFYKRMNIINDSLRSESNNKAMLELETQYETEKKEQDILNLKQAAEIQALTLTRKNYQILVATLVILLLAGAGYYYKKRLKLQKEKLRLAEEKKTFLEKELNEKARLLTTSSVQWINMTENLDNLKRDLKDNLLKVDQKEKKNLIKHVDKVKGFESHWHSFKVHFESVHPDFFEKLENEFPELTMKDLKVCAFLKMKMHNAEMAQIMDVAKSSIQQTKRRIKKKMNLDPYADLHVFLDEFSKDEAYM